MSRRVRGLDHATVIPLSGGDTITVKTHLNSGETRRMVTRLYKPGPTGESVIVDPVSAGMIKVLGYLLDWTFTDHEDRPLVIRHQSEEQVIAALDAIEPEDYSEVLRAIEAHDEAMARARQTEKNGRDGAKQSPQISPSPSGAAGASNGSEP